MASQTRHSTEDEETTDATGRRHDNRGRGNGAAAGSTRTAAGAGSRTRRPTAG